MLLPMHWGGRCGLVRTRWERSVFPARSARPLWNLKSRHSQDPGENQTGKKALAGNCAQEHDLGPWASLLLKGQECWMCTRAFRSQHCEYLNLAFSPLPQIKGLPSLVLVIPTKQSHEDSSVCWTTVTLPPVFLRNSLMHVTSCADSGGSVSCTGGLSFISLPDARTSETRLQLCLAPSLRRARVWS